MRHDAAGITIEYFPKKLEIAGIPMALNYNLIRVLRVTASR